MDRPGTGERAEAEQASRALIVPAGHGTPTRQIAGGRPPAEFLTQLLVGADPSLRPARSERTRMAASLYAQAARRA